MATVEVGGKMSVLLIAHLRGSRIYFLEILVIERGFELVLSFYKNLPRSYVPLNQGLKSEEGMIEVRV
jgi:hypothetical protein